MAAKILLNVSARRVSIGVFAQRKLAEVQSFPNDDSAWMAFGRVLALHEGAPVYLMVDAVEEDFRSESLPHVFGRARREMVARKLGQFFRTAPYRAAWRQGRSRDKRRDDQYLFLSLNSTDLIRPCLEVIEARKAPLAGIYLMPTVSQALVDQIKADTSGVLLVSLQASGLRQTFFHEGRLRISRLTPLEASGEAATARAFAEEIEKSRLFLYNSRLLSREARLRVWVIDPAGVFGNLCSEVPQEANLACAMLGREDLARAVGLSPRDVPQDTDALLLCLLGRHPPPCSLAVPRQTRGFRLHQMRLATFAAAASIVVAAALWSGYHLYARSDYLARAAAARVEAGQLQLKYDDAARHFPAAPASAEDMRKAVEVVGMLRKYVRTPEALMEVVGRTLASYPKIQLVKLNWRYGAETGEGANQPPSGPAQSTPAQWVETGEVEAEIRPFDGDYRAALALIERFAQSLRAEAGVADVRVIQLPVNLDPKVGLSGNTQDILDARSASAQFKVALRLGRSG
jgi:hypothetical protein